MLTSIKTRERNKVVWQIWHKYVLYYRQWKRGRSLEGSIESKAEEEWCEGHWKRDRQVTYGEASRGKENKQAQGKDKRSSLSLRIWRHQSGCGDGSCRRAVGNRVSRCFREKIQKIILISKLWNLPVIQQPKKNNSFGLLTCVFVAVCLLLLRVSDPHKGKQINNICYWPSGIPFQLTGSLEIAPNGYFSACGTSLSSFLAFWKTFWLIWFEAMTHLANLLSKEVIPFLPVSILPVSILHLETISKPFCKNLRSIC